MSFPWPTLEADANAQVQADLDRLSGAVALASGLASAHRIVDLAGLDVMAGRLCAKVLNLAPADGLLFRPALVDLSTSVTALVRTLRERR